MQYFTPNRYVIFSSFITTFPDHLDIGDCYYLSIPNTTNLLAHCNSILHVISINCILERHIIREFLLENNFVSCYNKLLKIYLSIRCPLRYYC